ncbi:MAG: hypothetical protein A2951_03100 [Candidatus Buchananbacteria bacterium RIFCSPLOWO2_01_FULL_56_15]|uniref:Divalent-cation tolerance protein CutA n=2 Tax=Candidatus Buchananiibacteriota TaxID=1817903 RepID=A0A1G1YGV4_9BACT|nr:MAG: hypothetical protein A3J59_04580 [Candidatus Buchananbacteria bacterium RIFCSPHIGHO2_02_FULL_56_16]OGY55320.1 MAG: hypothetical protein A2951_03100 [Candidatus Buchananbacteria bacterium RIFCSPLOWO2_01_FULL_56_15]
MLVVINVTCRNRKEATVIARALLKKKLVACVNLAPVDSVYWWENKLVTSRETALACKTVARNVHAAMKLIEQLHSYGVPVITVEKVIANKKALDWAANVTNH